MSVVQNRTVVDSLLSPSFFLVGFAILRAFYTYLAQNSPVEKSTSNVMTIDQ